jgi:hypothetical protein
MAARYRDHNVQVGNLMPGEALFRPEPVETIPMNPYSWDELIAIHRMRNTFREAAPAAVRIAPFRHSIHRRG